VARPRLAERTTAQKVTVTLAALAAVLVLANTAVPFLLIPYLQIDSSEIPICVAFFLFGPLAVLISPFVQWIFLNVTGSDAPPGSAKKFVAVVSTLGGLRLGSAAYARIKGKIVHPSLTILMMFVTGTVLYNARKGMNPTK
jgi:riboflavin transporter FmnP